MNLCTDCKYFVVSKTYWWNCAHVWCSPIDGVGRPMQAGTARSTEWACGASGRGWEPKEANRPRRMKGNQLLSDQPYHFYEHDEKGFCSDLGCQPIDAAPKCPKCGRGMLAHETVCQECYDYPPESQRPDPGDGFELCDFHDAEEIWALGRWVCFGTNADWKGTFYRRRRVGPVASAPCVHCGKEPQECRCRKYEAKKVEPVAQDCPICGSCPSLCNGQSSCSKSGCYFWCVWFDLNTWNRLALRGDGK